MCNASSIVWLVLQACKSLGYEPSLMQVKNSNLWSLNIRYHQKLTVSRNIWPAAFKYSPDSKVLQLIRIYFHCRAVPASIQNAKYFFWNVCMRANCTEWRNPNYLTATSGWSRCSFHQRIDSRRKECSFLTLCLEYRYSAFPSSCNFRLQ